MSHIPDDKSGTFTLFTEGHTELGFKVPLVGHCVQGVIGLHTSQHYLSPRNL